MPRSHSPHVGRRGWYRHHVPTTVGALIASVSLLTLAGVPPASAGDPPSGTVYTWGYNSTGQLGNGTTTDQHSPGAITVAPSVTATAIASGGGFSLAIGSDGNLYGWGSNGYGEVGNGTLSIAQSTPEVITLAPSVTPTAISAGRTTCWPSARTAGSTPRATTATVSSGTVPPPITTAPKPSLWRPE